MIGTEDPTGRRSFALALCCFAAAGVANTALAVDGRSGLAVAGGVAGTYFAARFARAVSRRRLATVAIGLWIGFLAVAGVHAIGHVGGPAVAAASSTVPGSVVDAVTWTALLGAGSATVFLAFREYGAETVADVADDRVVEGDAEY